MRQRALSIQPKRPVWIFANFRERMEEHFPKFPKVTSQSIPKFSKVFAEVFFPFNFARGKLEFSVELFWFRKFNYFRNFWKLFRENSVPFAAVSKFSKVLVDAKRQSHALKQEHQGFLPFTKTTWPEVLLFRLKSCARRCRSSMTTAITFSRENDTSSHTRTSFHYLVLRKSRTRGRLRLRI